VVQAEFIVPDSHNTILRNSTCKVCISSILISGSVVVLSWKSMGLVMHIASFLQLYGVGYGHINTLQSVFVADQFREDEVTVVNSPHS
jgi:hypothetical protein